MFGSRTIKRVAGEYEAMAEQTKNEINAIKSQNPFDTAASKSAMTEIAKNARQFYNRNMNTMGAGATPEAMVAAQGASQAAVASGAGQIAASAEAQRNQQVDSLRSLQQRQSELAGSARIDATKTAWSNFFNSIGASGQIAQGIGQGVEGVAKVLPLLL